MKVVGNGDPQLFPSWTFKMVSKKVTNGGRSVAYFDPYAKISPEVICLARVTAPVRVVGGQRLCSGVCEVPPE